ncbi:ABC transporter A family member 8 [Dichanthelium oligosanthes]|uniref:ABC transporter A family member 8 n=1 Tax=Dichanthelium oligosanthes TaxID=888268 RepID=A0A1E5US19_9POAL|nr:ABC transporter A family member 8 [Dichanthelium oligosanthes]
MDSPRGPASFATQADALLRKNLCVQKRNLKTNIGITFFPILICVLLIVLQNVINNELDKPKYKCGCMCLETGVDGRCARKECGIQYSSLDQVGSCPIPSPPRWPALIQVPRADFRAVRTSSQPFDDLPDPLCRDSWSCPASVLVTGNDKAVAEAISRGLFPALSPPLNATDFLDILSKLVAGSDTQPWYIQLLEPAFFSGHTLYLIQPECLPFMSQTISYNTGGIPFQLSYDFLGTTQYGLGVNVWYNSTYNDNNAYSFIATLRVPRLVNAVSNAYLKFIKGTWVEMLLEYVKDMPKVGTSFQLDLSSLLSALFFTWIIELLFPVILTYLVYEKQQKLKTMMKMHGLKDGPYWLISYSYFLALSVVYMLFFVIFGSLIGLNFFRVNEYSVQAVFFFVCINLQIALAFLVASFFSSVKLATGSSMGAIGMTWRSLKDPLNGMRDILIIMSVEWALLLILAFYLDQASLRKVVEQLLIDPNANQAIICDKLRKVYPGRDGNPDKLAVRGLSLVLQKGQCFGMLGPNGAGKTSFISMMIGLIKPTSGTAYVHGMDINMDMRNIYTNLGVCPQHNLLWETLTGKEHLFFYGRLKNLKGAALVKVPPTWISPFEHNIHILVLKNYNCYPTQWKRQSLRYGNTMQLKARFGGTYIFTMTTSPDQEKEVEQLVHQFSPSANKIYHLSGTQKFELPKQEVKIAHVFAAVENAKRRLTIHAWGLVDTTLEDVFIKVARGAQAFNEFA